MPPENTNEKLDKIADILGNKLAPPMAQVLEEIELSNKSRKLVLIAMVAMIVVFTAVSVYSVNRNMQIADDLEEMQYNYMVQTARLNRLVDLAEDNASTPEIEKELKDIQRMAAPTPSSIVRAAAELAPKMILEQAKRIELENGTDED